jgi:hypothetical protein
MSHIFYFIYFLVFYFVTPNIKVDIINLSSRMNVKSIWYNYESSMISATPQYMLLTNKFQKFYETRRLYKIIPKLGFGFTESKLTSIIIN